MAWSLFDLERFAESTAPALHDQIDKGRYADLLEERLRRFEHGSDIINVFCKAVASSFLAVANKLPALAFTTDAKTGAEQKGFGQSASPIFSRMPPPP